MGGYAIFGRNTMDKIRLRACVERVYRDAAGATTSGLIYRELKLDSSSHCQRFQTGLIFSQQHRLSGTDITNQTGFKKAVEGNAP